jgi:hypothetical protein
MHLLQLKFEYWHRIDVICAVVVLLRSGSGRSMIVLLCSGSGRGMIVLLSSGSVCVCDACVRVGEVSSPAMQALCDP